jgi:hypothetical protein
MLKAGGRTGLGLPLLMLGLAGENVTRLAAGDPIRVTAAQMAELGLPPVEVVIDYGRTEGDIAARWRAAGLLELAMAQAAVVGCCALIVTGLALVVTVLAWRGSRELRRERVAERRRGELGGDGAAHRAGGHDPHPEGRFDDDGFAIRPWDAQRDR